MTLRVRALSNEEREELGRMARSRSLGAGLVRRAQIVMQALEGLKAPEISARMDLCGATARHWLKRFNARGLEGLEEDVRTGRPPTYSAEEKSAVITTALTRPGDLGLPFASWTLDRLVAHLAGRGIAMRRSRISEIFIREGLKWRREETWFGERVDPDSRAKGGDRAALQRSTGRQRRSLPGRDGAAGGQELSGPAARRASRARGGARQAGDRLRPAWRRRLRVRRLPARDRCRPHPDLRARTTVNWVDFLGKVEAWIDPAVERVYAVLDNLNVHSAPDVLLFSLLHPRWEFVFQPKYAAYLNLIEPWWKVLRSLALKGQRFEAWAEIERAVERATAYWNDHKHPFVWGRRQHHRPRQCLGVATVPKATAI